MRFSIIITSWWSWLLTEINLAMACLGLAKYPKYCCNKNKIPAVNQAAAIWTALYNEYNWADPKHMLYYDLSFLSDLSPSKFLFFNFESSIPLWFLKLDIKTLFYRFFQNYTSYLGYLTPSSLHSPLNVGASHFTFLLLYFLNQSYIICACNKKVASYCIVHRIHQNSR